MKLLQMVYKKERRGEEDGTSRLVWKMARASSFWWFGDAVVAGRKRRKMERGSDCMLRWTGEEMVRVVRRLCERGEKEGGKVVSGSGFHWRREEKREEGGRSAAGWFSAGSNGGQRRDGREREDGRRLDGEERKMIRVLGGI
ncbi:hypothetical protein HAX54_013801 [Datura stramonium]|uniref:Uncharacterized protein n=1 Tax=Datura stramonium TaxID=4076 RepID=A0ABS8TNH3_DATST|nr:hypothetical protein [Datura stramonium]